MTDNLYFNTLSITGRVVDKPDYFEGLLTFTLYQEDTNLSTIVFYECSSESDISLHIGQFVHVKGKLCYDPDEDSLFLHANYIFAGEKPKRILKRQQMESFQQSNVPIKETNVVDNSNTEEKETEANLPPTSPKKEVTNEEVEELVEPAEVGEDDISDDFEVDLPPIPPKEEIKETIEEPTKEQPVQESPSPNAETKPEPKKEKTAFRLFNISEDAMEKPEPKKTAPKQNEQKPTHTSNQKGNAKPKRGETRFTISDFDC